MSDADLLDELRRECQTLRTAGHAPDTPPFRVSLDYRELEGLKRMWEHAAAERMRERCVRMACKSNQCADVIAALEPEEPSE